MTAMENEEACAAAFKALIINLKLASIQPIRLLSERHPVSLPDKAELQLNWAQSFPDDDPLSLDDGQLLFRRKYNVTIAFQGETVFSHESIFQIGFDVNDKSAFDTAWKNEDARKVFNEKQIVKTLWPFVRQEAWDGMTRLGLPGFPLPWLV